ncbi:GTPase-activating protein [Vibrio sp. SS-MA-C1-2]|uniref:Der GTPase-activating protein YihI n=1 Tax=Vibrio sp. SS-MA-C1-2 TaxID=2908646 RepID=UPI001EED8302|nr:Der GTPase-activating protein YihI [Vibrio sp. SS-MA-C1-2]UJF19429.1 GTPase-activating protein [Vibrio sp. SS-MA-C1-2]
MTRIKRSRRIGSEGPAVFNEKTTSESEVEGRRKQKERKKKGLKAGSRNVDVVATEKANQNRGRKDPRLGSKKPIQLVLEAKPHPKSAAAKKARKLSAEQELEAIENDAQLMTLIDRIEAGEHLGAGLQSYVDEKLNRMERLMNQLGLLVEDDADVEEIEPVVVKSGKSSSDEDMLDTFENIDLDQFKD